MTAIEEAPHFGISRSTAYEVSSQRGPGWLNPTHRMTGIIRWALGGWVTYRAGVR